MNAREVGTRNPYGMTEMVRFRDRREAGRLLAERLGDYRGRGGVMVAPVQLLAEDVAEEVARQLEVLYVDAVEALPDLAGGTVILVDDGFESAERVFEAGLVARDRGAVVLVSAAPVGDRDVCRRLSRLMDRSECLAMPVPFHGSDSWYADSMQVAATLLFSSPRPTLRRRHQHARPNQPAR
jgi:predicted phosphoribosyltransferase